MESPATRTTHVEEHMTASDMIPAIPRSLDQLLAEFGLEKRHSGASYVMPVIGIFAAGALVGGLLGLLLAPSSGSKLRSDINKKLRPNDRRSASSYASADGAAEDHHPQV